MVLSDADRTKYQANLDAAEAAYHSLMIGGAAAEFRDQNGESIRYTAANASGLLRYINYLRNLLGLCPFAGVSVAPPAGVIF